MTNIRCVWKAGALLGEGPIWDEQEEAAYWVDIKAPAVHRYTPASGLTATWAMPEPIGCIARRSGGGFVAGFKSGFAFLDLASGHIEKIGDPEPEQPNNRLNDGKCDLKGRFWVGTMDDEESRPTGWLYRLDPDRTWHHMDGSYVVTNGPAFSPDGRTIYHTDSFRRIIYAFDLAPDGTLANKRVFVRLPHADGYPDGMTTDSQGFLWVAHWGGWRVTRFTPKGSVDRIIELPVSQVTSCVFGGRDLDVLYITSAWIGLDKKARLEQPLAGGLFEVSAGVRGLPTPRFAG